VVQLRSLGFSFIQSNRIVFSHAAVSDTPVSIGIICDTDDLYELRTVEQRASMEALYVSPDEI
jgi:hypothetical protein